MFMDVLISPNQDCFTMAITKSLIYSQLSGTKLPSGLKCIKISRLVEGQIKQQRGYYWMYILSKFNWLFFHSFGWQKWFVTFIGLIAVA